MPRLVFCSIVYSIPHQPGGITITDSKANQTKGHVLSAFTVVVWGVTFVSTKILLEGFTPTEIMVFRTILALLALSAIRPHRLKFQGLKKEAVFAAAGVCGVFLYHLAENIALTYTQASNVAVVVSAAPVFTALLSREEKAKFRFFAGFAIAMAGIALISFSGSQLEFNPLGDLLALCSAIIWAVYSLLVKKIGRFGVTTIQATRRIFAYGLLFMLPAVFAFDFRPELINLKNPTYLFNLLFLGLGASALCFVTWNYAVEKLGAVKTSAYIYLIPVVAVAVGVMVLNEQLTPISAVGISLTLMGLLLSQ